MKLVVGAAVVDDLGEPTRLLAARRTAPAALAGGWEFPGGKVEEDETIVAALHRELLEELGVQVEVGDQLVGPRDGGWPLTEPYVLVVFLARIVAGEPQPLEDHDELRWLDGDDLFAVPWLANDVAAVARVAELMKERAT